MMAPYWERQLFTIQSGSIQTRVAVLLSYRGTERAEPSQKVILGIAGM